MPRITLTLAVGSYAIGRLIGPGAMTGHVANWRHHLPKLLPLPHPSWRTIGWERRNPWFGEELLPELRMCVGAVLEIGG
jgi:uracil-DNA glycosylase